MMIKNILILGFVVLLAACGNVRETKTLKLAHGLDVNHSVHKAMLKMGEELETLSGGRMSAEVYPNQQLGSERENLELLQIGSLDMTKVSSGVLENFSPGMKVFGLPFLFRDKAHAFSVLDGEIGQNLLNESERYWLKGLSYYDAGSRSFYTKKPVNTPDDLKGQKIRVMESESAMDMVRSLGGSPTPISWGELYTSLQQGVVDGAENNPPSFYLSKHYEVCRYYTLNEHTMLPDVLLISTHTWNRLTEEEQDWVQEAVRRSVAYQRELWKQSEQEALEAVKKAGVTIIHPDKEPFFKQVEGLYAKYKENPELADLIGKIRQ
jgi:tripartite ATP-independent transporter DctP family solute receptor